MGKEGEKGGKSSALLKLLDSFFHDCCQHSYWKKKFQGAGAELVAADSDDLPTHLNAFANMLCLYFDHLLTGEDLNITKEKDIWAPMTKRLEGASFGPVFCGQFKRLSTTQKQLVVTALVMPEDSCVSLLSTGPLLYSSMRQHLIKQELRLVEFRYISRKTRFLQSKAQGNVFRVSYSYAPASRFEAIATSSNPSQLQSLVISLTKKIRNELHQEEESQRNTLASFLPQSKVEMSKDKRRSIEVTESPAQLPKPACIPLAQRFVSPAFRAIRDKDYKPKDEITVSANKMDCSRWVFGQIEVTLNEEGQITLNVKAKPTAFTLLHSSTIIAPETFIEQDLPSNIMQNEELIRRISSNMKCVHTIFEKLSKLQKESSSAPAASGMKLSPQEEEVLGLPDNVLLLGRSGTGKTTCALLRLFSRYKLFEEYKESMQGQIESSQHFHPLFITLSPVLCSQAQKYFQKLINEDVGGAQLASQEEIPKNMHLGEAQFPLFLTLRQFLKMLDGTLEEPFFVHDSSGAQELEWKNDDDQGLVRIVERKLEPIAATVEDLMEQNEAQRVYQAGVKQSESTQTAKTVVRSARTSFEINYEYFEDQIVPQLSIGKYYADKGAEQQPATQSLHPAVIWTEIQSTIKGSLDALLSPRGFLTLKQYIQIGKKRGLISKGHRTRVYYSFLAYESKKRSLGAFDLQDIIFHLFTRLRYEGYRGTPLHSITIDEVQDFSQSTLQLLMMMCKQQNGFFFTGDTCQTIARGVGFRFRELQGLFYHRLHQIPLYKEKYTVPEVHQLTVNFRSHSALIKLGNSIIKLLENLFPNTIDVIAPDQGTTPGPLPSIMKYSADEDLFAFLFGQAAQHGGDDGKLPEIEQFGAHQVVITRNQATKALLPDLLKHALCLTVYEAKGLEFDDVILFNFFSDSATEESWRVITPQEESGEAEEIGKDSPSGIVRLRSSLEREIEEGKTLGDSQELDESGEYDESNSSVLGSDAQHYRKVKFEHNRHSILCSELKHLYVAVTRPRKNLYIFERDMANVKPMLSYWMENRTEPLVRIADAHKFVSRGIVRSTTPEEWRKQGKIMLEHQYYPQAVQCFTYSNDDDLLLQATALLKTKQAGDMQKRLHSCVVPEQAESMKQNVQTLFREAGEIFLSISFEFQAAQCFVSCCEYNKAAELFKACGSFEAAAEAYVQVKEHKKAAECFLDAKRISQAAEQYFLAKMYFDALDLMNQYPHQFDESLSLEKVTQDAIHYYLEGEEADWVAIVRIVSYLSRDVSVKLENAVKDVSATNGELLDQLHAWGLHELNVQLLQHSLAKERNLFFYKRLQAYAFTRCFELHTKLQETSELSAQDITETQNSMVSAILHLQESDQVQILLTLGYFPLLASLKPSPMIISLLGSVGLYDLAYRNIADSDNQELCLQVLLDQAYSEGFHDSPLSIDVQSLELNSLMKQIESTLATFPKGKAPQHHLQAFQLLQSCMEPGTRVPFLVSSFTKQKKDSQRHANPNDRTMQMFFISSFLMLSHPESHKPERILSCAETLLAQLFAFLHTLENPQHSKSYAEDLLDILSIFNLGKDIQHSVGFPGSITLNTNHVLSRLQHLLSPDGSAFACGTETNFYRYHTEDIISVAFYSLLALGGSLLNFACYELPKICKTEYSTSAAGFSSYLARFIELLQSSQVKKNSGLVHLISSPKKKMQWLLNEHSLPKLPYLYQKADRMAVTFARQLEVLWYEEGRDVSPSALDRASLITFAQFKWKYIRDIKDKHRRSSDLSIYAELYRTTYQSQCNEIQQILSLVDKSIILTEFLQHDESRPAEFPISFARMNPLHRFVWQMKENQQKGYLLQSVRCLNEMFVYAEANDLVEIIASSYYQLVEDHFAFGVALYSALEDVDVLVPSYWIDRLYEVPCAPVLPENMGDLMSSLLELMYHCVSGISEPRGSFWTVPLAILSHNCSIPSVGYDDELLDLVWDNKDNFELYEVRLEIVLDFLKQLPLMTGEPSEFSGEEFTEEAGRALDCKIISYRLTEYLPPADLTQEESMRNQKLLRAQRITAAHHLCSFVRSLNLKRALPKDSGAIPPFYFFNSSKKSTSLSVPFVTSYWKLFTAFEEICLSLFASFQLPSDVVFDIAFPLFKAYQLLWDISHSSDLIAGEYQTVLATFENEMNSTVVDLQKARERVNQFLDDDEEEEKQEEQGPGSNAWRQRQIQRLLRQRQGLRKQHALQKKVERVKNQ